MIKPVSKTGQIKSIKEKIAKLTDTYNKKCDGVWESHYDFAICQQLMLKESEVYHRKLTKLHDELFYIETGMPNEFRCKQNKKMRIFDNKRNYTEDFIRHSTLNCYDGKCKWECFAEKDYKENLNKRICMEDVFQDAKWRGRDVEVHRYMTKSCLLSMFGIKMSWEDCVDLTLIAGFSYVKARHHRGYVALFDVAKVLFKYEAYMQEKWGDDWKKFRLHLLY